MPLHPILVSVSLITQLQGAQVVGSATGFFYERQGSLFLVTNQHVVKDKDRPADKLRLRLHTDANDLSKNADYEIVLYDSKKQPLWKNHATEIDADIAVVKLDRAAIEKSYVIRAFSAESFLPKQYALQPGEDVFIIGYPLAVSDVALNLPVLRGGMVASAYGPNFNGKPFFLTDINLHRGTSGSPVLAKPKNAWINQENGNTEFITGTNYYLLGVHSGTLNVKDPQDGTAIGLGAAWYIRLVEEICATF